MNEYEHEAFSSGHRFLEAPRWHDGQLWVSDFFAKTVLRFAEDGSAEVVASVEGTPSGLGFLPDGRVLVVSQQDAMILEIGEGGSLTPYADYSHIATSVANEMLVSADGHVYAGNFGFLLGAEEPRPAYLAHVAPDRSVRRVDADLMFPNGTAMTPDGTLLVAETISHRITAFDLDERRHPVNPRVWAQLDDSLHPDGIALDSEGGVWFGNALTLGDDSGFYRVVEGGEITDRIPTRGTWAVACAFGGEQLNRLYMSCNTTTLDDFLAGRSSGEIRVADVKHSGVPHSQ
ncbi:SMP-30/gluconolactonase/LRE family protein (plasmid) [Pseudonocardia bannensis]|uniref:SMP-30/gluconolactonase/LRE family protein n=1 Tax=Pseudonocardia bannensis TaxID=630973 RepID=A0A848DIT4_9PSEU|nr:SMP-30/gluconolactonase/LRE family protein [Pseudonocardia bannensis]NMH92449.1 SMP-30/gluconolactonase/LRE family protein [Pseudonocardia bannensis]